MTGYTRRWKCLVCEKTLETMDWPQVTICEPCTYRCARQYGKTLVPASVYQELARMGQRLATHAPQPTPMLRVTR